MQAVGHQLAQRIRASISPVEVVYLYGDLGAGKTTLVKGLVAGMLGEGGSSPVVTSPTFTLVEQYDMTRGTLFHLDLYRLESPRELEMIGLRDMLAAGNLLVVEWPDRGRGTLPPPDLKIAIGFASNDTDLCRTLTTDPAILPQAHATLRTQGDGCPCACRTHGAGDECCLVPGRRSGDQGYTDVARAGS